MSPTLPPLTEQANSLLSDILAQSNEIRDGDVGPNSVLYRAQHKKARPTLDALEQEGFLQNTNYQRYRLTLKGLFVLRNAQAKGILELCEKIFVKLSVAYEQNATRPILVDDLASSIEYPKKKIAEALVYLRDARIWGGHSTDLLAEGAFVSAGESILDSDAFDSVMKKLWESHLSQYPEFNELIFSSAKTPTTPIEGADGGQLGHQGLLVAPTGLSDAPIPVENDALGYKVYTDAIVDFLTNENTRAPFSIAITGSWGSGKTTLLRWIKQALENHPNKYPTVWFSPWKHSEQEEVWAAFARSIIETLVNSPWKKIQLRWKRFTASLPAVWVMSTAAVVGMLIVAMAILNTNAVLRYTLAALGLVAIASPFINPIWRALRSPLLKLLGSSKGPDYDRKLGFQKEFEKDLSRLLSIATTAEKPLFIFVDDLDRAPPPVPVKLLEAMNILIGQEQCIFIVGLDLAMVTASIETKYFPVIERMRSSKIVARTFSGRDFIEKLMQLEFALPTLTVKQLETFLDSILTTNKTSAKVGEDNTPNDSHAAKYMEPGERIPKLESTQKPFMAFKETDDFVKCIRRFSQCLPKNPRKIKRFINCYRLLAYIAARRGLFLSQRIRVDVLGAVTVLAIEYPEIYMLLTQDSYPTNLQRITVWLNDRTGSVVKDDEIADYGLTTVKEHYRMLLDVLNVLISNAKNIEDYLSLSEVIVPGLPARLVLSISEGA